MKNSRNKWRRMVPVIGVATLRVGGLCGPGGRLLDRPYLLTDLEKRKQDPAGSRCES